MSGSSRRSSDGAQAARLAALEALLGHAFADKALLTQALTHASAAARPTNERLEFLGDRVLGLCVGEMLYARFPDLKEGDLALKLNRLVRLDACAEVAAGLGLGEFLILSPGEAASGGRAKPAILGDACEALIGALYLDGGLEAARRFVVRAWSDHPAFTGARRDAKTALQEWAQGPKGGRRGTPVYVLVSRAGPDHAPRFRVRAKVEGQGEAEGEGATKRDAEQAAAAALLARLVPDGEMP